MLVYVIFVCPLIAHYEEIMQYWISICTIKNPIKAIEILRCYFDRKNYAKITGPNFFFDLF